MTGTSTDAEEEAALFTSQVRVLDTGHRTYSRLMISVRASLTLDVDTTRKYQLPGDGSPSLLYYFGEQGLGARAYSADGRDFSPGSQYPGVRLVFWAEAPWTDVVVPGASFVIWYGGDVGRGVVEKFE